MIVLKSMMNISRSNVMVRLNLVEKFIKMGNILCTSPPPTRGADPPPRLDSSNVEMWLHRELFRKLRIEIAIVNSHFSLVS